MTITKARLRDLLQELAEEAQPAPFLHRLDQRAVRLQRRRALTALVAVAAAVAVVAASAAFVGARMTSMPQPAHQPADVFELGPASSVAPGPAWMAVTVTAGGMAPVHVAPEGGAATVTVPVSDEVDFPPLQRLSSDGTRLTRVTRTTDLVVGDYAVEVLDLTTGRAVELEVRGGHVAELSPDNRIVAVHLERNGVRLVDVATGAGTTVRPERPDPDGFVKPGGVGWSPDGTRLAVIDLADLVILDREGTEQDTFPGVHLVNGSQSWSPDSRSILVYDGESKDFAVQPVDGGEQVVLTPPADAVRPLGWAGDRVVWLAGQPGSQRLVTAGTDSGAAETWVRFEVGDAPVESVTWSRALSG